MILEFHEPAQPGEMSDVPEIRRLVRCQIRALLFATL